MGMSMLAAIPAINSVPESSQWKRRGESMLGICVFRGARRPVLMFDSRRGRVG